MNIPFYILILTLVTFGLWAVFRLGWELSKIDSQRERARLCTEIVLLEAKLGSVGIESRVNLWP